MEEYVGRIQAGESSEEIMKGLPDSFRTAIEAQLNPDNNSEESEDAALLAQEAKQETRRLAQQDEISSANKANKVRAELGIPLQVSENSESNSAKEASFKEQVKDLLLIAMNDKEFRDRMDHYRNVVMVNETEAEYKKRQSLSDLEMISIMSNSLYGLIHKSGMSYDDVVSEINIPNKDEFIKNFSDEISDKLVETVSRSSKVRHITDKELIQGDQPDQAAGFVWFKGNALRPANAREVRFYINASPDGTTKVADYLAKLSDQLDQYGIRLQFKFRRDLGDYDRTDTCVAYVYMPAGESAGQKNISDQWLEKIKATMAQCPKDALRNKNSLFTDKIVDGISFAEDTREAGNKRGESYTSQITKIIGESAGELSQQFSDLTPEAMEQIIEVTLGKLKQMQYFK